MSVHLYVIELRYRNNAVVYNYSVHKGVFVIVIVE